MEKTPRDFIFDNLLSMSAYWACTGAIIASLTAYYGFSLALSNVVTGLSGTLPILQLAGGLAYERTTRPLRFLRLCNGTWRVLLPLVFFSVLLPRTAGAPLMVVCYVLAIGIYQFACPSQTDWLVSSVEGRVRGDYYSVREMFFMLTYTGVFCAVSLIIDRAARHGAQQTGFLAVGVLETMLLAASLTVLLRLPAPERPEKEEPAPAAAALLEPLRNRRFRRVMLTNMVWSLSGMFIGGFAAVYQIQVLELTFFEIMVWVTAGNLCRVAVHSADGTSGCAHRMEECYRADHCDDGMRGRAVGGGHPAKCSIPVSGAVHTGGGALRGHGRRFPENAGGHQSVRHAQHVFFRQLTVQRGFSSAGLGAVLCAHQRAGGLPAPRTALHLFCGLGRRSCRRSDGRAHSLPGSVNRGKQKNF